MDINKLSDKIIVKKNVAEILSDIEFETPKEKIAALSMIYSAERQFENPLILEESDYETDRETIIERMEDRDRFAVLPAHLRLHLGDVAPRAGRQGYCASC